MMLSRSTNDSPEAQALNVSDALNYLNAIKSQFEEQPHVYNQFLALIKQFRESKMDVRATMECVALLFNGHPSLIQGFNFFLPIGYEIKHRKDELDKDFVTVITPGGRTVDLPSVPS